MRMKRGLLRALVRYARSHPDPDYRRAAEEMNRTTMQLIAGLLLTRRREIGHPHPETAIPFGLMSVAAILGELIIEEKPIPGLESPEDLDGELVRMFLGYLGVE